MKDQAPAVAACYYLARCAATRRLVFFFRNFASQMATNRDVRQRGSGPLSGEHVSGRLRPAPPTPPEPNLERIITQSPLAAQRRLSPAEFNNAIIHFYRGEVQRSNVWRTRLDTTTYWAVLLVSATLSFTFSSPVSPHFVIPINSVLVAVFLMMEARRYRYYEIWASRVRVIETGYFAQMLAPESLPPDEEWSAHLASDLITPHFTISQWEAVGRRLRRNYLWIFALLALSWNLKVYLHPDPAYSFDIFIQRARVGVVPGWLVFTAGFLFNAAVAIFAIGTIKLREATGEVLPRHELALHPLQRVSSWTRSAANTSRRTVLRTKRARHRVRSATTTGEFKKIDISETPNR